MPHFNPALKFAVIGICALCVSAAQAETFSGKVVAIADGNTLTVLTASRQQHKIRLAEIDAPEKSQPHLGIKWHQVEAVAVRSVFRQRGRSEAARNRPL
jgi:endonuclease YncB( thermonuclease family)